MRKILAILVLGLALVGSCFAKEANICDQDKNLTVFNALSVTIKNPVYITDLPEEMLKKGIIYEVDGKFSRFLSLNINEEDFKTEERPVVRIGIDVEYDSRGSVSVTIYISTFENQNQSYNERKTIKTYYLQCLSLDTWTDAESVIEHLQKNPDMRVINVEKF